MRARFSSESARRIQGPVKPVLMVAGRPSCASVLLNGAVLAILEHDPRLGSRSSALELHTDIQLRISLSATALENVLHDVLNLAFRSPHVWRVSLYAGQLPGCERITVVAEYGVETERPRLLMLGRIGDGCVQLPAANWPSSCSATWFDNSYEHIYRISIQRPSRTERQLTGDGEGT